MNKLFAGTKNLILSKQHSLIASTAIISMTIVASRLLGLMRYHIYSSYFTKAQSDILLASFRIPDIVFEIIITGALSSVLIPLYIKYQKDKEELNLIMSSIINILLILLVVLIGFFLLAGDWIIAHITPGFSQPSVLYISYLSKILLLGQLPFLIFSNVLTSFGQAKKTFILTSIAPIAYNLCVILATILFAPTLHIVAPVVGVVAGACAMFVIQIPLFFSAQIDYKPVIRMSRGLKEFGRVIVPRIVVVLAAQLDATIDLTLTSLLGTGSYTAFYYAQALQLFPVSFIGISLSQAALPHLSEAYHDHDLEKFKRIVTESILAILFLTIPIVSFFVFARTPLVRLVFGGRKFDWDITVVTAQTLTYFALGIPAHSIYYVITKCFYAFLDSKTPFYVSLASTIINTILSVSFVFIWHLPVWYLALAFSFSITLNVVILLIILSKRVIGLDWVFFMREMSKIFVSTFIASFATYWGMKLLDGLIIDTSRTINVFLLLAVGSVSYAAIYFFLAWTFGVNEVSIITKFIGKTKHYRRKIVEIYTDLE
jgi:putative peptidoglycan lipid II flippase